jgi:hypothetical protein
LFVPAPISVRKQLLTTGKRLLCGQKKTGPAFPDRFLCGAKTRFPVRGFDSPPKAPRALKPSVEFISELRTERNFGNDDHRPRVAGMPHHVVDAAIGVPNGPQRRHAIGQ